MDRIHWAVILRKKVMLLRRQLKSRHVLGRRSRLVTSEPGVMIVGWQSVRTPTQ